MDKERICWIDIAKGIGLVLVLAGHCCNKGSYLHNWIFSFHMPMFFILSGLCFKIENYSSFSYLIKRKTDALLIPYMKFFIFALIFSLIIPYMRVDISIKAILYSLYTAWPGPIHIGSIWYLICLFICMLVYWILYNIGKKINCKYFIYIMLIISGILGCTISILKSTFYDANINNDATYNSLSINRLPLTIDTAFTAIIFFSIGVFLINKINKLLSYKYTYLIILVNVIINIIFSLLLNTRVNLHGCSMGNPIYFYIAAITGSYSLILISYCISKWNSIFNKLFSFIGRNSLLFLGVQSLGINIYTKTINFYMKTDYILFENVPLMHCVFMFLIVGLVFWPISYFINKLLPEKIKI